MQLKIFMATLSPSDLLEQHQWRYATKQFDPNQVISNEVWKTLEDSLVLTPSSFGLQPWKFIVVTDQTIKEQLKPISWNQSQITDCSHLVVFAIKKNLSAEDVDHFIETMAQTRDVSVESLSTYRNLIVSDVIQGPRSFNVNEWTARQVYIALGNFMTSAALLGVDSCPLEGIDPFGYNKVLNQTEKGFATIVACAAGYRSAEDKYANLAKVRYPNSVVVEKI